ncbi:cell division protein FtsX [Sphingomonas sp. TDK1]|uniref:cell division protein FtsX n=1 Tax=Sphingomonas sp. TDK1 TaxID=453247 RepID=UPI0007DA4041|nr:FtsX-like permease family protein [Sphingomonas sp. TDK1]OAN58096.1 permease [Sphingomonas sp. TDK1]
MNGFRQRAAIDLRLLGEGQRSWVMAGIMAIMLFLTVLAGALGLGVARSASGLDRQLAGQLTVQLIESDVRLRDIRAKALVAGIATVPGVTLVRQANRAELAELLKPWLGDAGLDPDLPMPVLIDVTAAPGSAAQVAAAARHIAPQARVDSSARWLSPVRGLLAALGLVAIGLVLVIAAATAGVALLVARAGLDTHRDTIDVLHMLGSTDLQVARLLQRRIARDTLLGGALGTLAALALVALFQTKLALTGSDVLGGATLLPIDWTLLLLLPLGFALLATVATRMTVLHTLGRKL